MFTGLVRDLATVAAINRSSDGARLRIDTSLAEELAPGDSVAVNGVCLTATAVDSAGFEAEAVNETLGRSTIGGLAEGAKINLELPLRVGDRLGGHWLQGHVDGLGRIAEIDDDGFARRIRIETDEPILRYLVEKGSIGLDGVSLTLVDVDARSFVVSLIPETLERTNLGTAELGALVNLEVDVLAKYVEKAVQR